MTEYKPGTENIYLSISRSGNNVCLGIHLAHNDLKIYGVILPPEVARTAAQKLTEASWVAEEASAEADSWIKWMKGEMGE